MPHLIRKRLCFWPFHCNENRPYMGKNPFFINVHISRANWAKEYPMELIYAGERLILQQYRNYKWMYNRFSSYKNFILIVWNILIRWTLLLVLFITLSYWIISSCKSDQVRKMLPNYMSIQRTMLMLSLQMGSQFLSYSLCIFYSAMDIHIGKIESKNIWTS